MNLEQQIEELRARVSRLEAQVRALQGQNGQGVREAPTPYVETAPEPGEQPNTDPAEQARQAQIAKNQAAIQLLRRWATEGDEDEQRETFEYLKRALDEDRLSYRKLFP